jgi:hypothetical protein
MNGPKLRLIAKYALLLSVFYIFSIAFYRTLIALEFSDDIRINTLYKSLGPIVFDLFLNLIMAYIVQRDIAMHNVKTKYVIIATIIYRSLGVFSFLLFLHFQHRDEDNSIAP